MRRFFKKFRYGEKGFTLIELLVVVAIIGVLAAVVIPNVGKFMGSGSIEGANTEAHNVSTGVLAAMADTNTFSLTADGKIGPDRTCTVTDADGDALDVMSFINGNLEAEYTIAADGHISSAIAEADGKWKDLTYTEYVGWAEAPAPGG